MSSQQHGDNDKDYLKLRNDKNVIKMLQKIGDNFPSQEIIKLSAKLSKINRKGKEQHRILMVTNRGISYQTH